MPTVNLYINPSGSGSVKLEMYSSSSKAWIKLGITSTELHVTQIYNLFRFTVESNIGDFTSWNRDSPTGSQLGISSPLTLTISTSVTVYANFGEPEPPPPPPPPPITDKKVVVHGTADITAAVLLASKLSGEVERWNLSSGNPDSSTFDNNDIYIVGGPLAGIPWIKTVYDTYLASKPNLCEEPYFIKSTTRSNGKVIYIIYGQIAIDTLHVCESYPNCPAAPVGNVFIEIGRIGSGNVNVNGDPITSFSYMLQVEEGTILTFDAVASNKWKFVRWQGDFNSLFDPYTFTALTNGYFEVVFAEIIEEDMNVTVNRNNIHGKIKVDGSYLNTYPQDFQFSNGDIVRFEAEADSLYHFVNWSGAFPFTTTSTNPVDVTMNSNNPSPYWITANFAADDVSYCTEGATRNTVMCEDGVTWKSREVCSNNSWIPQTQDCPDEPFDMWWIILLIIVVFIIIMVVAVKRRKK